MDAWETLLDNSTLASTGFDAWEHLNAQEGGGGGGDPGTYYLADGILFEVDNQPVNIDLLDDSLSITIEEPQTILVSLDGDDVTVSLSDDEGGILLD